MVFDDGSTVRVRRVGIFGGRDPGRLLGKSVERVTFEPKCWPNRQNFLGYGQLSKPVYAHKETIKVAVP